MDFTAGDEATNRESQAFSARSPGKYAMHGSAGSADYLRMWRQKLNAK
jgi:hypothetical protein